MSCRVEEWLSEPASSKFSSLCDSEDGGTVANCYTTTCCHCENIILLMPHKISCIIKPVTGGFVTKPTATLKRVFMITQSTRTLKNWFRNSWFSLSLSYAQIYPHVCMHEMQQQYVILAYFPYLGAHDSVIRCTDVDYSLVKSMDAMQVFFSKTYKDREKL